MLPAVGVGLAAAVVGRHMGMVGNFPQAALTAVAGGALAALVGVSTGGMIAQFETK